MHDTERHHSIISELLDNMNRLEPELSSLYGDNPWKPRSAALLRKAAAVLQAQYRQAFCDWSTSLRPNSMLEREIAELSETFDVLYEHINAETNNTLGPMWSHYSDDQLYELMIAGVI
ncbi:hypothetical protein HYP67_gp056 [Acinetobacter phage vB_ApiM_fHyAci03]|uniref:Uncharacterized protein n=1 Tax=Acinetobacter phage vB_ApiM_fHyAci03 TaxID=2269366 RepID=A0A345AUP2_9CAUD|nr:hypothetical protein HYP67_gp056 [Acinetobacter phage vB_ApiM_fHyAci03]AXF40625.1 hypothetical protein Ac3_056 [Acinetobacter phage vB_ApiM_fHyAci03]